jgi:hypothetical protein
MACRGGSILPDVPGDADLGRRDRVAARGIPQVGRRINAHSLLPRRRSPGTVRRSINVEVERPGTICGQVLRRERRVPISYIRSKRRELEGEGGNC